MSGTRSWTITITNDVIQVTTNKYANAITAFVNYEKCNGLVARNLLNSRTKTV